MIYKNINSSLKTFIKIACHMTSFSYVFWSFYNPFSSFKRPPVRSVPSFYLSFRMVAQLCAFFSVRDITNREQCLCSIGTSSTTSLILRLLDILQQSHENGTMYYCMFWLFISKITCNWIVRIKIKLLLLLFSQRTNSFKLNNFPYEMKHNLERAPWSIIC